MKSIFDKTNRFHDKVTYPLKDPRRRVPKEKFEFLYRLSKPFIGKLKNPLVIDIGCATGEFLYFLSKKYPKEVSFYGCDIDEPMLGVARRYIPGVKFFQADITNGKGLENIKADAIFVIGFHHYFDNQEIWIKTVTKLLKPRGRAYIFGLFNADNVDMVSRVKYSDRTSDWQIGWNLFSRKTIVELLNKHGCTGSFVAFNIGIDVARHKNDPLRSWTIKLSENKRLTINGAGIIQYFTLLEIKRIIP